MLPSGVERGVGTRTSLEGRRIFGFDGEAAGDCCTPLNTQSPMTLSQAFLFVLTKFSGTSASMTLFSLCLGLRLCDELSWVLRSKEAFREAILDCHNIGREGWTGRGREREKREIGRGRERERERE